uniref:Uncharacterized protein n=1 Tax=Arundo donax TaxID=35708 RepID=A0A0A9BFH5_ARUDO
MSFFFLNKKIKNKCVDVYFISFPN